jgi:hypothetical protein
LSGRAKVATMRLGTPLSDALDVCDAAVWSLLGVKGT